MRASEEPHRVEESLTTTLATAYTGYKNNLDALEYYRKFILPDQVRYYRGVFDRRQIDPSAAFGDLVTAQQTLVTDVTSYLGILGSLWMSVVSVADLLQTDDLFQLGQPLAVPALPDLEGLSSWPCCHECPPPGSQCGSCLSIPTHATESMFNGNCKILPAPEKLGAPLEAPPLSPTRDMRQQDKAKVPTAEGPLTLPAATNDQPAGGTLPKAAQSP
jgi:hypothetical protein